MKPRATIAALLLMMVGSAQRSLMPPTFAQTLATRSAHEQLRRDLQAIFSERTIDHGVWSASV